jgi:capsid protein
MGHGRSNLFSRIVAAIAGRSFGIDDVNRAGRRAWAIGVNDARKNGLGGAGGWGGGISAYDAGRTTRLDPDFSGSPYGPNALADGFDGGTLEKVRQRSSYLHDSDELIDASADTWTDNVVGTGIDDCEPDTGFKDLDDQIREVWSWAIRRVDPERCMSLAESQRLFARELRRVGECGRRVSMSPASDEWPVMPTLELIDADRVGLTLSGAHEGNEVRQGIEYAPAPSSRVVAYHVYRQHPSDGGLFGGWGGIGTLGTQSVQRIPAGDGLGQMELAFVSRRIEQLRGVPKIMSAMSIVRVEQGYVMSTMTLADVITRFGLVFQGDPSLFMPKSEGDPHAQAGMVDAMGRPVLRTEAGGIAFVPQGTQPPTVISPNHPGPQFDSTDTRLQQRISKAAGLTYSQFSGDSSRSNFSSMRGDSLDARKSFRPWQKFIWEHHTQPWRRAIIDWAILAGHIRLTAEQQSRFASPIRREKLYACTPGYPGWDYVNPAQEANAAATDMRGGVRSPVEVINERGGNWRTTIAQTAKFISELTAKLVDAGMSREDAARTAAGFIGGGNAGAKGGGGGDDGEEDGPANRDTKKDAA